MTTLSVDTPIGAEVARLAKTAALSEESATPRPGGTHIHTDEYARQMGFEFALVPGVTLLGYVTEMLSHLFGETWFEHGTVSVRFRRPVYDKDPVVARAVLKERRKEDGVVSLVLDVSLECTTDGRVAVVGEATYPASRYGEVAS